MIILGIDPGYGRLGYALLEEETLLDYSCIETSPKKEKNERLLEIAQKIEKIIEKYHPEVLAIEKLYFTTNQKTALSVAEAKGIVIYLALKNKMKIVEYNPLEVKTAVCGYGKASKKQVEYMVKLLVKTPETIKLDDTADAIALCLTCAARRDYR